MNYRRIVVNVSINGTKVFFDVAKRDDQWLHSFGWDLDIVQIELPQKSRKQSYQDYLQSPEWRARATDAKERAGWKCQVCNTPGDYSSLSAHHRTYERVRNELPEDLIVLCAGCHEVFHTNGKLAK